MKWRSPKNSQLLPLASCRAAFLDEGAERRDAGAGADHDDVATGIGERKMTVGLELDAHPVAPLEAFGDVVGGDAFARPAMEIVAHRGD